MTYDAVADAAFIYLADPIEPGAAVSGSTRNRSLDRAAVVRPLTPTGDYSASSCSE